MLLFLQIAEEHPYIVDLASQGERVHKRQLSYSNIRIHPVFTSIASTATAFLQGANTPLSRAIDTLERLLQVHPVQGNLLIPPTCREYTYGLNAGKCRSPLPSQSDYECGDFGVIPLSYIGTRLVCTSSYGSCTMQGPNSTGLPNADYLLFVSASSTCKIFSYTTVNNKSCAVQKLLQFLQIFNKIRKFSLLIFGL